jgi:hypothetical protein
MPKEEQPVEDPPTTAKVSRLVALRLATIIGVILLFSGAIIGLFVDVSAPRYIAMIGAVLWGIAGTAFLYSKKRPKRLENSDWQEM